MAELSDEQIARQDMVDNAIYEMLTKVLDDKAKLEWDIDVIGAVRSYVIYVIGGVMGIPEEELYASSKE